MKKDISRRNFLKILGGGAVATAAVMTGCKPKSETKTQFPQDTGWWCCGYRCCDDWLQTEE